MNLERTMATRQGEGMVWRVQKVVEWEIGAKGYKEKEQKRARSRHLGAPSVLLGSEGLIILPLHARHTSFP